MRRIGDHILLCGFVALLCGPVLWVLSEAVSRDMGRAWVSLDAVGPGLAAMIRTSLGLALGAAFLSTALSFLAAYALVFCAAKGAVAVFWISVATLYFPIEARMLQTFDVTASLGLTSTLGGLILPVLQLALGLLVFRQHFKGLPPELLEAARLDGAGPLRFLWDLVLPLSRGPAAAVFLITFITGWNQYLWPLMVSVDDRHWTLVRALERVSPGSEAGLLLAASALLPPLALILLFQRALSRGLTDRGLRAPGR